MHRLTIRSFLLKVGLLIFLLIHVLLTQGQSTTDSLETVLRSLPEKSVDYQLTAIVLSKYYAEINPDTALFVLQKVIANEVQNKSIQARTKVALSTVYSFKAMYDSSTYYAFAALDIAESSQDSVVMIDAYNNLGIDHMFMEEDEKAVEYFSEVRKLSELIADTIRWGHALNNLGMMVGYSGDSQQELTYYQEAAELFRAIGDQDGLANTYLNSGTVFTTLDEFQAAEDAYQKALEIFRNMKSTTGIQNTLQSKSGNFLKWGIIDKAYTIAYEALELAQQYSLKQDIIYTYELLKKIALAEGNYRKAFDFQTQEALIKETVLNQEKNREIAKLETLYETEKKEAEIKRLTLEGELKDAVLARSRNTQVAITAGAIMVVIIISIYFVSRNRRLKAERENQDLQVEALKKRFLEIHASPKELAIQLDLDVLNEKLHAPLTTREFEALKLSVEGKTNNEIADSLFISVNTVKFHLKNSYSKMGVGNRKEAFQFVLKG